jgi:hypothetical protein
MLDGADAEGWQGSGWRSRLYRLRAAASRIESVVRCGGMTAGVARPQRPRAGEGIAARGLR